MIIEENILQEKLFFERIAKNIPTLKTDEERDEWVRKQIGTPEADNLLRPAQMNKTRF